MLKKFKELNIKLTTNIKEEDLVNYDLTIENKIKFLPKIKSLFN